MTPRSTPNTQPFRCKWLRLLIVFYAAVFATATLAQDVPAKDAGRLKTALETAMSSNIRTEAEKARDKNRKPIETLEFFWAER